MSQAPASTSPRRMSARRAGGWQRGYSQFELICVIIIASVLMSVLLNRTLHFQALAEKHAMEMTIINMRSGLRLQVAELLIAERMDEVGDLVTENPINWLEAPPPNYLGELRSPEHSKLPGNTWYFDPGPRELVYIPRRTNLFWEDPAGEETVVLRVTAAKRSPVIVGSGAPKVQGIALVQVLNET